MTVDLSLVPTDALVDELMARCDAGVIAYIRDGESGRDDVSIYRRWRGNAFTVAGLAFDVARMVTSEFGDRATDISGGVDDG